MSALYIAGGVIPVFLWLESYIFIQEGASCEVTYGSFVACDVVGLQIILTIYT